MNETRAVNGTGKMVSALIWLALIYAGEVAGVVVGMLLDADLDLCATLGGAIVAVLGIFMMKGGDYLRFDGAALFESWKFMWWIVAISAILMVLDLYDYVSAGEAVQQGWALRLLSSLVLCLAIGASEEGMFRGMLFGGLLARFGGKKNGILWAVAVSSLVFGCAHVTLDDFDPNNLLTFAQAGLKICQTGMYAVMLCAVVLKTKSLVGAMTVHAIDDWLLFVVSTGLYGETFETEYVTPDREEAIATIVFYLIICVLYLPTFIKAVMELRAMQAPQFGPFVSEHEVLPVGQQPGYLPANQGVAMGVPGGWQQAPTQALPGQQGAYQQVPMQQVPVQQVPMQQGAYQQATTQQMPMRQVPVQQGAYQQVPVQAMPVQQVPAQQVPQQPVQAGPQQAMQPIHVVYYPIPVPAEPLMPDSTMPADRSVVYTTQGMPVPWPMDASQQGGQQPSAQQQWQMVPMPMPVQQVLPQQPAQQPPQQAPQQAPQQTQQAQQAPTQWPSAGPHADQRPPAPDGM